MPSIRTMFLWALAAAAPVAFGHTWGEQLRNINDKGEYVGAYGYMRGYRVRGGPDFNEDAVVQRMPASNENGKIFITADQLLCHENQREQKQASNKFPRLQTTPGNFVAIRYQENGHITTADTIVSKPENGGTVYVYGTTDPKSDEKLVDVLQWTQNGEGGDSRGVLLAMNDYDDRRCYLNNETPIAQERKIADPAYMAGTPQSGPANSVMYCETDVKLPDTIEQGKPYTLYWVWQWPTLPGKNDGLPNGKDEYYSTCIDVDIASPNVALAAEDASQLAKFAMLQQDAVSTAVSDWASRTALFSDLPSKREMGPVFSSLPNGSSTGRYTQTASLTITSLATDLGTVSNTKTSDDTSVINSTISSRIISSQLPVITETGQNIVSSSRDIVQSASFMDESSAVSLDVSHGAKSNSGDPMQTGVQPPATASAGVSMSTSKSTSISTSQPSTLGSGNSSNVIRMDSQLSSPTLGNLAAGLNASSSAFGTTSTGQDTQVTSATMTSLATKLGTVSNTGTGEDTSVNNTTISSRTINNQLPVITETGQNIISSTGDVVQSTSNSSRSSTLRSGNSAVSLRMSRSAKPNLSESIQPTVQPPTTASAGVPISTSTTTLISASPSSNIGLGTQNETLKLSPAAVEALRLALFLKNLGAAALNTSSWPDGSVYTSLADLLAEFLEQENTQQGVVRDMLNRTGSPDVPACAYVLPNNASEMVLLVSTLKSIEVGTLLALASSLPPKDHAAIVLFGMAPVAARQYEKLSANTNSHASTASFETLISGTLAYNLVQNYVQPGSCAIELSIHNLPVLYINNRVAVSVHANASVTFKWDAAGKAAASRSGKELFIGWINQVEDPHYTRLKPLGDGVGTTEVPGLSGTVFAVLTAQPGLNLADLTDATLAGPVEATIFDGRHE